MRNKPLNLQQLAPQMSGHVFTGNQKIIKAAAVIGSVGKTDKRQIYTGNQTVVHNGFSIMGDATAKVAVDLREPKKIAIIGLIQMTNPTKQRINAITGEDDKPGERGHTPSRGAPCQYLVSEGVRLIFAAREAKLYLPASHYEAWRKSGRTRDGCGENFDLHQYTI